MVADSDNAGVGRHVIRKERKCRLTPTNQEHLFADAGTDGVDRHERPSDLLTSR